MKKAVFIIICQGDSLNEKILRTCRAFHCNLYPCPANTERREELEKEAITGIGEIEEVSKYNIEIVPLQCELGNEQRSHATTFE